VVTSENDESRLASVQQSGVSAIFDKPFDPSSIKDVLYRVLEETA
jgi:two-component system chemotaxis response regulator CheY